MACVESVKNEAVKQELYGKEFFWNVSGDVGYGGMNYWADVKLVQYLINKALGENLNMDGVFGPKTYGSIKKFQKCCANIPIRDGKVDTIDGSRHISAYSKGVYTILMLNHALEVFHPLLYNDITADSAMPGDLRSELRWMIDNVEAS